MSAPLSLAVLASLSLSAQELSAVLAFFDLPLRTTFLEDEAGSFRFLRFGEDVFLGSKFSSSSSSSRGASSLSEKSSESSSSDSSSSDSSSSSSSELSPSSFPVPSLVSEL
eukprot:Gregarina_sp_Pseudo_9__3886@NODE_402_length_2918_cov_31_833623_g379_i0_p6_GENE_NODE_402_length_2918_cov_31_833623_g379_i0NODE_402_length_2918_cov_31_833623_g379_i0_p6_ORF_typecomplete_len111_score22_64DUF4667/PF15700_5/0_032CCDC106/PF15794_5/0_74_NODE_402_length_2918_cov_31_833623_g379_i072404